MLGPEEGNEPISPVETTRACENQVHEEGNELWLYQKRLSARVPGKFDGSEHTKRGWRLFWRWERSPFEGNRVVSVSH